MAAYNLLPPDPRIPDPLRDAACITYVLLFLLPADPARQSGRRPHGRRCAGGSRCARLLGLDLPV